MKRNAPRLIFSLYPWLVSALALPLLLGSAAAQRNTGIIGGHVADREGAVLQGASVKLEPGDISGATNGQGEFTFIGLAPGNYTLTISYVGFATFTQQVRVVAGQTTRVEANMVVLAKGEEVTVVADAYGLAEAINEQRTSDNILNVMPKGVIQSLPNANIADVAGRMPGVSLERDEGEGKYVQVRGTEPRLTNTTVDGVQLPAPEDNVRQFKLDTIPSNIVGSVELQKTLSPNQDAEAIGGTVNLVTKKASDAPTLQLEGFAVELGGSPEFAAADGQGFVYNNLEEENLLLKISIPAISKSSSAGPPLLVNLRAAWPWTVPIGDCSSAAAVRLWR